MRDGPRQPLNRESNKLALTIYHMLQEKTPYQARGAEDDTRTDQERQLRRLRQQAKHLGFDVVPQTRHEDARSRRGHCVE